MAYTGPPERQSQVSSAVASSIWDVYDKGGKAVLAGEQLDFLLIDCEVRTMGSVRMELPRLLWMCFPECPLPLPV